VTTTKAQKERASKDEEREVAPSARYTPPIPREFRESGKWVPVLMFTFLILGVVLIIVNYTPAWPYQSNWYLLGGLGLITLGFITATKWR
jgi:cell division septal protein FtsQ